jgi:signal transduction histidine kinase
MRLAEFIRARKSTLMDEWVLFGRSISEGLDDATLRDHVSEIIDAICADMETPQSEQEQQKKSEGRGAVHALREVGQLHAGERVAIGFRLQSLMAEYRAFRANVHRRWKDTGDGDPDGVTRFNEAIDEVLMEAAICYTEAVARNREQFLAILGHDLRNPLGAILMMTRRLVASGHLAEDARQVVMRIERSSERMSRLVNDLLDLTRVRLGSNIPVQPTRVDLGQTCDRTVAEVRDRFPNRVIACSAHGDVAGQWDEGRLSQVITNLVINALKHGDSGPIRVAIDDAGPNVTLSVHNHGKPIPNHALRHIFEPMVTFAAPGETMSASLGLGLFVVREIVKAHHGDIRVTSNEKDGTTFTVVLPRHPPPSAAEAPASGRRAEPVPSSSTQG